MIVYEPAMHLTDGGWATIEGVVTCSLCGALVMADTCALHDEWHDRMEDG